MQKFSMGFEEVLQLRGKTFWMLHRSIDRLNAEEDQRQLVIAANAMSGGNGLSDMMRKFQERIGIVMELTDEYVNKNPDHPAFRNTELDEMGLESLKGLGSL